MPSIADKLRQYHGRQAPSQYSPQSSGDSPCYIREEHFSLSDVRLSYKPEIMRLLRTHSIETLPDCSVEGMLFLDTETTGLSGGAGTCAFLVGIGYIRDKALIIRQFLMLFMQLIIHLQ